MLFPYRNIVILTGAGISAESGIQTFRAQDGLWEKHRIEDVATPEGTIVILHLCRTSITNVVSNLKAVRFSPMMRIKR